MNYAPNDHLFPTLLPSPTAFAGSHLEDSLIKALWKNKGDIVHAYAVVRRDGEELLFPVSWSAPRPDDNPRSLVARKVASLALHFTREGALLVGFR